MFVGVLFVKLTCKLCIAKPVNLNSHLVSHAIQDRIWICVNKFLIIYLYCFESHLLDLPFLSHRHWLIVGRQQVISICTAAVIRSLCMAALVFAHIVARYFSQGQLESFLIKICYFFISLFPVIFCPFTVCPAQIKQILTLRWFYWQFCI